MRSLKKLNKDHEMKREENGVPQSFFFDVPGTAGEKCSKENFSGVSGVSKNRGW